MTGSIPGGRHSKFTLDGKMVAVLFLKLVIKMPPVLKGKKTGSLSKVQLSSKVLVSGTLFISTLPPESMCLALVKYSYKDMSKYGLNICYDSCNYFL